MAMHRAHMPIPSRPGPLADAVDGINRATNALRDLTPLLAAVEDGDDLRDVLKRLHTLTRMLTFMRRSLARRKAGLPEEGDVA